MSNVLCRFTNFASFRDVDKRFLCSLGLGAELEAVPLKLTLWEDSKSSFPEGQFNLKFVGRMIRMNQPSRKAYSTKHCAFGRASSSAVP